MNLEDALWLAVAVLMLYCLGFMWVTNRWQRLYNLACQKLVEIGILVQCSHCHYRWESSRWGACPLCAKGPTVSVEEYKKKQDDLNRKSRPGSPTEAACPECGKRMFRYLQGSVSKSKGRLFCKNCPHEEEL